MRKIKVQLVRQNKCVSKCYLCHPAVTDQRNRETKKDYAATSDGARRQTGDRGNSVEKRKPSRQRSNGADNGDRLYMVLGYTTRTPAASPPMFYRGP